MTFDHATLELIQVAGFLTLLLMTHRRNSALSNAVLLWFVCSLTVDVFVLKCIRPYYVKGGYNTLNVLLGWIVLYEKCKVVFRHVVVFLLSLLR